MCVFIAIHNVMVQLSNSINHLSDDEYNRSSEILSGASIGEHVRHIIEFYQELDKGYEGDLINYEKRKRDKTIEQDREKARFLIQMMTSKCQKQDKDIIVEMMTGDGNTSFFMQSTYFRELGFLLEHTVHHMAMIRIGIMEVSSAEVPEEFGLAYATIIQKRKTLLPQNN
ncbi:hypothetical protein BH10BAC2_BH10BAC2_49430 [soil metagenome]